MTLACDICGAKPPLLGCACGRNFCHGCGRSYQVVCGYPGEPKGGTWLAACGVCEGTAEVSRREQGKLF